MSHVARRTSLVTIALFTLLGAGCTTKPVQRANLDGTYCFSVGKWYSRTLTCTPTAVPPQADEVEAKQFLPAAGQLTVYVVRKSWGDAVNQVRLSVDAGAPTVTTPASFVRLRVEPGAHVLKATWKDGTAQLPITGAAGEIRVVELIGTAWSWGSTYRLEHGDVAQGRDRVKRLRMVADVL